MKRMALILLSLALAFGLVGCGTKPLDEAFDADSVESCAIELTELVAARDYDGVNARVREDLSDELSPEILSNAIDDYLSKKGAYSEITKIELAGNTSKETGEAYAVALVTAKFEKGSIKFAISFDTDYNMVGLYIV